MALSAVGDLVIPYGRLKTPYGYVLFCLQCADNRRGPTLFTYLHGFYVRCGGDSLRGVLRSLGANCSSSHSRIMCPYCVSRDDDSVHDGFFRLWRSVQLPRALFADAWAAVDKTGWRSGGRAELMAAAEALAHGPRLPMMLGRNGPEGTPASVLLASAQAPVPGPTGSLQGMISGDGRDAVPSTGGVAVQAAVPGPVSAPEGALYVAAHSAHATMQAASCGIVASVMAPPDTARLASTEARLAALEVEVQRLAMVVTALPHGLHDFVRRVGE
jgi:hypothetical protein